MERSMAQRKVATKAPRARPGNARESGSGARTILVLQRIAEAPGELTLSELARAADMPPSSTHRILQPLLRAGLVARSGAAYRIGPEYYKLAASVLSHVNNDINATPFLDPLWTKWQETAIFCLYRPAERIGLVKEMIQSPHPLRHFMELFEPISLVWGSLGRAILAHLSLDQVTAIRDEAPRGRITGAAAPSLNELLPELELVRERGIAIYRNEGADLAGVAAPVFRSGDVVVGSVGLTMPVRRYDRLDADALCSDVMSASRKLGSTLGHSEDDGGG